MIYLQSITGAPRDWFVPMTMQPMAPHSKSKFMWNRTRPCVFSTFLAVRSIAAETRWETKSCNGRSGVGKNRSNQHCPQNTQALLDIIKLQIEALI